MGRGSPVVEKITCVNVGVFIIIHCNRYLKQPRVTKMGFLKFTFGGGNKKHAHCASYVIYTFSPSVFIITNLKFVEPLNTTRQSQFYSKRI